MKMLEVKQPQKIGRLLSVIFGPPGTGKTTRLLDILEGLLSQGVHSASIAFVSFTRSARREAIERVCKRFGLDAEDDLPWFRTLHSTACRLRGGGVHVIKKAEWADFCKKHHYELSEMAQGPDDDPAAPPRKTEDDEIRAAIAWGRHRCLTLDETLRNVKLGVSALRARKFAEDYETFKLQNGCIDFEDMLEHAKSSEGRPPVDVAIIDEAQDLSPLLSSTAAHWFGDAERVYVAGDDDQAIYEFQGADPSWLMSMHSKADDVILLDQSYRIPAVVHELAQRIIASNKIRVPKTYKPRAEQGVIFWAESFKEALTLVGIANNGKPVKSVFILARNWRTLQGLYGRAKAAGLPYSVLRGKSAPLDNAVWVTGIKCAQALSRHESVKPHEFLALLESIPARKPSIVPWGIKDGKNGVSKLPESVPISRADIADRWDLAEFFALLDAEGPIAVFQKPKDATPDSVQEIRDYFRKLLDKYGELPKPIYFFSSDHSVKGGEADVVVLLTDMGKRSYRAWSEGTRADHEAENRVAYVAVTRTKQGLILVAPKADEAYPFQRLAKGLITDHKVVITKDDPIPVVQEQTEPIVAPASRVAIETRHEKPYVSKGGELILSMDCELRYRWWAGGQSIVETLIEIKADPNVIARYRAFER